MVCYRGFTRILVKFRIEEYIETYDKHLHGNKGIRIIQYAI